MKYKQVIFDLDGTLVDSTKAILNAFKTAHSKLQLAYPGDEAVKSHFGKSLHEIVKDLNILQSKKEKFIEIFTKAELEITDFTLINGMREIIEKLNLMEQKIVIVTSKRRKTAIHSLSCVNLFDKVDLLITADDVEFTKPKPDPILKACEKLGLSPNRDIVYIGDTKKDAIAAERAGVSTIYVTWGVDGDREDINTKIIVHSSKELFEQIF